MQSDTPNLTYTIQGHEFKAPPLAAGLHLVATPLGNLADVSLRSLAVLAAADIVLCEDTRITSRLMQRYSIATRLKPYHDHNAASVRPWLLEKLGAGAAIALVSDAGMPMVSDPGYKLVRDCIAHQVAVDVVPGPTAPVTALALSGLPSDRFFFAGFLPPRSAARQREIERLRNIPGTLIFFETGPRIEACLRDLAAVLGDRAAVITRELTKHYEEARHGILTELADGIADAPPKGEIVLLVHGPESRRWDGEVVRDALRDHLQTMKLKAACAELAEVSGWSKRELYALGLSLK